MSTLEIKDLHVHVETKEGIKQILKGASLTVHSGETHAIMGPNGSGKSTLAYTLAGHPKYVVDSGEALLDGQDILKMTPDERAKAGLFLAMQYPVEVPGVSMTNFLRTAKTEIDGEAPGVRQWTKELSEAMKRLKMDPKFATRSVNEGFSGGEKKRAEVLQLELLKPKFAILDETDSGLDVDALRIVSEGVNRAKEANQFGILMVTHYTRVLKFINPDIVHLFGDGHFLKTGGPVLVDELEENVYAASLPEGDHSESALACVCPASSVPVECGTSWFRRWRVGWDIPLTTRSRPLGQAYGRERHIPTHASLPVASLRWSEPARGKGDWCGAC